MALFRDGVKIGNKDIRIGLSKKRGQGILRKLGILEDDKGRKKFEKDGIITRNVISRDGKNLFSIITIQSFDVTHNLYPHF